MQELLVPQKGSPQGLADRQTAIGAEGTMRIFDGVTVNPTTLSPTWQGVISVAMLLANTFVEAGKIRDERVAKAQAERQTPTTLEDVMEQSGLKLPHLHDVLTAFMGGTDEAKEAATLIVNTPDPVKLLRDFAKQYAPASAANGPIVTPPPAAAPAWPMPAPPPPTSGSSTDGETASSRQPQLAKFRPEFTREAREAALKAEAPRPQLAKFRPEFTREGREAAKRAGLIPGSAAPPSAPVAAPAPAAPSPACSLTNMLADRLAALTRQVDTRQAELETRIRCAEAELAELDAEMDNLRMMRNDRRNLFVVSSTDEMDAPPITGSPLLDDPNAPVLAVKVADVGEAALPELEPAPTSAAVDTADDAALAPSAEELEAAVAPDHGAAEPPVAAVSSAGAAAGEQPLPPAASQAELARAFEMMGTCADQLQARYARDSEHVRALERKISVMRGRVERERGRAAAVVVK